ncbi:MAG: HypC/HybG/HupF family hydrogenase formation chaperone [Thermoleophilaceae bacterium]
MPLRVVEVEDDPTLALCADADGGRETVETSLVGDVREGMTLLVHAGVAIQRLGDGEVHTVDGHASVTEAGRP